MFIFFSRILSLAGSRYALFLYPYLNLPILFTLFINCDFSYAFSLSVGLSLIFIAVNLILIFPFVN